MWVDKLDFSIEDVKRAFAENRTIEDTANTNTCVCVCDICGAEVERRIDEEVHYNVMGFLFVVRTMIEPHQDLCFKCWDETIEDFNTFLRHQKEKLISRQRNRNRYMDDFSGK